MIIANPIYDVVFKRLMENERIAKFFIGTMLGQKVERISLKPQEFTYTDRLAGLAVFRMDFIAVINTANGENKKVLIEIQKAKNEIDLMRFRNYLAEQYKKKDELEGKKEALPITTIYILGFKLPEIETACIHVERQYRDMINDAILEQKSDFVERLTHDSYVVQVGRISGRYQSRLDKLLSVFEQKNFVGDKETLKEYLYQLDDDEVKEMAELLHHTGTDPESKEEIEREWEAWRSVNAMFEERERTFEAALVEKDKELTEKDKELTEKDKELEEQKRIIEELKKKLKG